MSETGRGVQRVSSSDQQVRMSVQMALQRYIQAQPTHAQDLLPRVIANAPGFDTILFERLGAHGLDGMFATWARPETAVADIVRQNHQARGSTRMSWHAAA